MSSKGPSKIHACSNKWFTHYFNTNKPGDYMNIEMAQTGIKSIMGCGDPITVNFYAPLNEDKAEAEIDYSHEEMGKDFDLLLRGQD